MATSPRFESSTLSVPEYRSGRAGEWALEQRHGRTPGADVVLPGYWSAAGRFPPPYVLTRSGKVWMSTSLMECESQSHHVAASHGHTVIAGLGMGVVLYNVLSRPNVTRVTVVEKDPDVISAFHAFTTPTEWPGWEKASIVNADIFGVELDEPADFLYMDIWPLLGQDGSLDDTLRAFHRLSPARVGSWGQEFEFLIWCKNHVSDPHSITDRHFHAFREDVGLPLIPDEPGYASMAVHAVINNVA